MSRDDSHADRSRSERDRDPESGLFERIRAWSDVFPWLCLARTLRLAGSPPLVLLTYLTLGVWWLGQAPILGDVSRPPSDWPVADVPLARVGRVAVLTSPASLYQLPVRSAGWRTAGGIVWSLLIWTPIALLLTRQGALLTAGRPLMGLRGGIVLAMKRTPRAWLVALVPSACVALIAISLYVVGWVGQLGAGIVVIETGFALLLALMAIAGGLLAFGAHFAIPLGWAAIVNEQSPDPLDSLSRGYEYLLRRPLRLAAYLLLSLLMMFVIGALAVGIESAAVTLATGVLGMTGDAGSLLQRVRVVLHGFPLAVVVTLGWGMLGGAYLLLRRDAGGQEVEDVWMPPVEPTPPLPSVPHTSRSDS